MIEPTPAYVFLAEYVDAHDGDTLRVRLDHGRFPTSKALTEAELRVRDLYCPELREPGGPEARDFTRRVLGDAGRIVVQTYRGSFARTVADVWVDGQSLAAVVIAAGHGSSSP